MTDMIENNIEQQTEILSPTQVRLVDMLSESYRDVPSAAKFNGVDDLFQAYTNLESVMGKKVANMTEEDIEQFAEYFEVDSAPEQYEFPEYLDPELSDMLSETFQDLELSQNDVLEIMSTYEAYAEHQNQLSQQEFEQIREESIAELQQEFGHAYDQRVELANRTLEHFATPELYDLIEDAGLANSPALVKFLSEIGQSLTEDSIPRSQHGGSFGLTPQDAQRQIALLMADPSTSHAYYNKFDPKHAIVKEQITELYDAAYNN